mmetsp:Transcript_4715/g.11324  ORF Transcript_4715/g.11324 Transcript_4715/m.11324 type:complete len:201 (-) Transcript_4715:43-645(-)
MTTAVTPGSEQKYVPVFFAYRSEKFVIWMSDLLGPSPPSSAPSAFASASLAGRASASPAARTREMRSCSRAQNRPPLSFPVGAPTAPTAARLPPLAPPRASGWRTATPTGEAKQLEQRTALILLITLAELRIRPTPLSLSQDSPLSRERVLSAHEKKKGRPVGPLRLPLFSPQRRSCAPRFLRRRRCRSLRSLARVLWAR